MGNRTKIVADKVRKVWNRIKKVKNKEEEQPEQPEQPELTIEEREEILTAGYALSRKYKYHKLMKAADPEVAKIEGREVHGYMQRIYGREKYEWLIDNDVFDIAVDFALKYHKPEIFNVVKNYDFDKAIINIIYLPIETYFDLFPNFEFGKIIVLTQDEPFENCVHWIENQPWTTDDGYRTTKTLAPCNFLNTGFTLWDLPVMILKDAVGMDKMFFKAKITADEITRVRDQLLKKHIYTKRQEELTSDEKYLELEIKHEQLEKRHQYMVDEIKFHDYRNPYEKLEDFAKKHDKRSKRHFSKSSIKRLIIALVIIALIVIIIAGLMFMFGPKPSVEVDPETSKLLLSNVFNRGYRLNVI